MPKDVIQNQMSLAKYTCWIFLILIALSNTGCNKGEMTPGHIKDKEESHQSFSHLDNDTMRVWPKAKLSHGLLRVKHRKSSRFGYVDTSGKLLIPFTYTWARDFKEGHALVGIRDGDYVINTSGEELRSFWGYDIKSANNIIFETYDKNWSVRTVDTVLFELETGCEVRSIIRDSLFIIKCSDEEYLVDIQGKRVLSEYDGFSYVTNSNYIITYKNKKSGIISSTGELICPPIYHKIGIYREGYRSVRRDSLSGFIDNFGREVIPMQYRYVDWFANSKAIVNYKGKFGIIDTTGSYIIKPTFDFVDREDSLYLFTSDNHISIFNHNLSALGSQKYQKRFNSYHTLHYRFQNEIMPVLLDSLTGFINKNGKLILQPQFTSISAQNQGYIIAKDTSGHYALIDKKGKIELPPNYDKIKRAADSSFIAHKGIKTDLYRNGKIIMKDIPFIVEEYTRDHLIVKNTNDEYSLMNKKRKLVLSKKYDYISTTSQAKGFILHDDRKKGYYNPTKKLISISPTYDNLEFSHKSTRIVTTLDNKKGILDSEGRLILFQHYDDIKSYKNCFLLKKGGKFGVIDKNKKELIPLRYDKIDFINGNKCRVRKGGETKTIKCKCDNSISFRSRSKE